MTFADVAIAAPQMKAGKVKTLAMASDSPHRCSRTCRPLQKPASANSRSMPGSC